MDMATLCSGYEDLVTVIRSFDAKDALVNVTVCLFVSQVLPSGCLYVSLIW